MQNVNQKRNALAVNSELDVHRAAWTDPKIQD